VCTHRGMVGADVRANRSEQPLRPSLWVGNATHSRAARPEMIAEGLTVPERINAVHARAEPG
jgi:hypothetical protein